MPSVPSQGKNYLWCQRCRVCRLYSDENFIVLAEVHREREKEIKRGLERSRPWLYRLTRHVHLSPFPYAYHTKPPGTYCHCPRINTNNPFRRFRQTLTSFPNVCRCGTDSEERSRGKASWDPEILPMIFRCPSCDVVDQSPHFRFLLI